MIDDDSLVGYRSGGNKPNRWFTISVEGAKEFSGSGRADFQVKLWERGTIDVNYRNNVGRPGDGSAATIGLEAPGATDAFLFSFREPVVGANGAYRYEVVPTGVVSGVVTNANDGLPVEGATITAEPGGRTGTTDADGRYSIRLVPGRYELTATANNYEGDAEARYGSSHGARRRSTSSLAAPSISVAPTSLAAEVEYDTTTEQTVTVTNDGSAPLTSRDARARSDPARDSTRTARSVPTVGPSSDRTRGNASRLRRARASRSPPSGVTFDGPLEVVIDDPDDDAVAPPEVTQIQAGSDGTEATIQIDLGSAADAVRWIRVHRRRSGHHDRASRPRRSQDSRPSNSAIDYFVDLFDALDGIGPARRHPHVRGDRRATGGRRRHLRALRCSAHRYGRRPGLDRHRRRRR